MVLGVGDTDNSKLSHDPSDNSIKILTGQAPSVCQGALTYSFRFSVTDQDNLSEVHSQTIVFDGPIGLNFVQSSNNIPDDNVAASVGNIGSFTTTWSGSTSTDVTYTLHDIANYPDNAKFTIGGSNGQMGFTGDSTIGKISWNFSVKIIENSTKACKVMNGQINAVSPTPETPAPTPETPASTPETPAPVKKAKGSSLYSVYHSKEEIAEVNQTKSDELTTVESVGSTTSVIVSFSKFMLFFSYVTNSHL